MRNILNVRKREKNSFRQNIDILFSLQEKDDIEEKDDEAPRQEKVLIRQKCLLSADVHQGFKDEDDETGLI